MKKWLDDLYAILLKRSFKTLDNSLKNYDDNQKIINDTVYNVINEITIQGKEIFTYDLRQIDTDRFITLCFVSEGSYRFFVKIYKLNTNTFYFIQPPYYYGFENINIANGIFTIKNSTDVAFTGILTYNKNA